MKGPGIVALTLLDIIFLIIPVIIIINKSRELSRTGSRGAANTINH